MDALLRLISQLAWSEKKMALAVHVSLLFLSLQYLAHHIGALQNEILEVVFFWIRGARNVFVEN